MTADKVNVPVPDLVTVPVLVAIGSATVVLPLPSKVNANVPAIALPDATSNVSVPSSDWISLAAARVIAPDKVLVSFPAVDKLRTAPDELTPDPVIESGSAIDSPVPLRWIAPPSFTVVVPAVVPSDVFVVATIAPAETVVDPVKELAPESVSELVEVSLVIEPAPEMVPESV